MDMQTKVYVYAGAFFGSFLVAHVVAELSHTRLPFWVDVLIFVVFALMQFVVLVCPHCGKCAVVSGKGARAFGTPFVGDRCERCGKPF